MERGELDPARVKRPGRCWSRELIPKPRLGSRGAGGVQVGARGDTRALGRAGPRPLCVGLNSQTRHHQWQIKNMFFLETHYRLFF